ncbi:uncharacterized protein ATNIH1004_002062 [Aspergillus tanneri]|uniref:Uncharacterized protein n=1 Tax=Aspergillus tanneri TaxID=1220188 RepID=A0A5M9M3J5_9EURO|nr:uncharacterized protein ATNIH1004_002062 [Aspergillus tanneri]KAA8641261.1 hypothetical protein ATNIH1004_002062 [Aspergillus tanneri]
MAQRPNNTDLPPKQLSALKERTASTKRPGDWGVAGTGHGQMRWSALLVLLSARYSRVFEPASILPYQPSRPLLRSRTTDQLRQTLERHKGVAGQYNKHSLNDWQENKQHLAQTNQGNGVPGTTPGPRQTIRISTWTVRGVVCTWTTRNRRWNKGAIFAQISNTLHKRTGPDRPGGQSTPSAPESRRRMEIPPIPAEAGGGAGVKRTYRLQRMNEDELHGERRRRGDDSPMGDEALRRPSAKTPISKLKTCESAGEPLPHIS